MPQNKVNSKIIEDLIQKLRESLKKTLNKITDLRMESKIHDVLSLLAKLLYELQQNEAKVDKYIRYIKEFAESPDDLLLLLSLPEIPRRRGMGKAVIETVVGYRGLGIETIDHYIKRIEYEGIIPRDEEGMTDVSMTSFMYRFSPFELVYCPYENDLSKKLSEILGNRFTWLIKPWRVKEEYWQAILRQVGLRGGYLLKGTYDVFARVIVPNTLTLVDISDKCFQLLIQRPHFFMKLGSPILSRKLKDIKLQEKRIETLRALQNKLASEIGPILAKWGLRLDYVYFCYKGLAISTDPFDVECPHRECPLRQANQCDGRVLWSAKYYRRKFFPKIYPLRRLRVWSSGKKKLEEALPLRLISLSIYDKMKLIVSWYAVELGTWFINARPTIRIFFDRSIGYHIPSSALVLEFDREWIDKLLASLFKAHSDLRKIIALKFLIGKAVGRRLEYRRLGKVLLSIMRGEGEYALKYQEYVNGAKELDDEILQFMRRALLHTLLHKLAQYIVSNLVGVDLSLILFDYDYKGARLILAENARNNGLGIIDTVLGKIEKVGLAGFLLDFLKWLNEDLMSHDLTFDDMRRKRQEEAQKVIDSLLVKTDVGEDLKKKIAALDEKVRKFRETIDDADVLIDVTLARLTLLVTRIIEEREILNVEDFFDDILEKYDFPLCLDGCNACVRLERYCNEGFLQILTTSKLILKLFVEELLNLLRKGISLSLRNMGQVIIPVLSRATKTLDICCPYISPKYAKQLIKKASEGVKVRVLTSLPEREMGALEYHIKSVNMLKEASSENLNVRVSDKILAHAKIYIVDGRVSITGSMNLTERSLSENMEHADIKIDPTRVSEDMRQFEEAWSEAKDLS